MEGGHEDRPPAGFPALGRFEAPLAHLPAAWERGIALLSTERTARTKRPSTGLVPIRRRLGLTMDVRDSERTGRCPARRGSRYLTCVDGWQKHRYHLPIRDPRLGTVVGVSSASWIADPTRFEKWVPVQRWVPESSCFKEGQDGSGLDAFVSLDERGVSGSNRDLPAGHSSR